MWNKDDVKPAPTSWNVMFDPKVAAKYKGKISAYDESDLHRRRGGLPQDSTSPTWGSKTPTS